MPPLRDLDDGLITGTVVTVGKICGHCESRTFCVHIDLIKLPAGIEPSTKLIPYTVVDMDEDRGVSLVHYEYLGIGCGCYARFHRQIAHIEHHMRKRDLR